MFNISISLSNGDISLMIIVCSGFIYFINYFYSYFKKTYKNTRNTIYSINDNLQQLNYNLNEYIYANRDNILKIRKNSENVNNLINMVSFLYTIKCYYDVIKPIINNRDISNILIRCVTNLFDKNNIPSYQYTDTSCSTGLSNLDIKNNDNVNKNEELYSENFDIKKNKLDGSTDGGKKPGEFNNMIDMIDKIINDKILKNDNNNTDDKKINNMNTQSDNIEIKKKVNNDENISNNKNLYNLIDAHPKLYLSNGLKINEKENIQNKFNEYIYNTDKLKNDMMNNDLNKSKKICSDDLNKINENIQNKLNELSGSNIVGINDGNMSYAPFN